MAWSTLFYNPQNETISFLIFPLAQLGLPDKYQTLGFETELTMRTPLRPLWAPAVSILALLAPSPLVAAQQPSPVYVEPVVQKPLQQTERVTGSLRARSTSQMAALEEGVLLELKVREADAVQQGDVLARIDTRRLEASKAQMQAELAMAGATLAEREAQLTNAEADLAALEAAAKSGAISERDLRNAQTQVRTASALAEAGRQSIEALRASLDLLDIRIQDATVKAPFDATVTARHAEVGQWIRPGDPLVTLVSTGPLEAWLNVPERLIGQVNLNAASVAVHLEATGLDVPGTKPRLIPMVDERARSLPFVLDLTSPTQGALQPGMSISARLPLGAVTQRLVVPRDAIIRRGPSSLVVKVGADNLAEHVPVKVLFTTAGGFAVSEVMPGSLPAGTQVIVEGNERIFPGTPVQPMPKGQPQGGQGGPPPGSKPPGDKPQGPEAQDSSSSSQPSAGSYGQ